MQTALRISNPGIGSFDYQRNRIRRHHPGDKPQQEKKIAPGRKRNGFLTGKIQPFAPEYCIDTCETEGMVNVTTKENFDYLYHSAVRYTGLMNVELPFCKKKGGNTRMNIINLYKAMDNLLPEHINLEVVGGKLHFCLYRFHDWPDFTLFWIPLEFTRKLPRQLKRIMLEFIQRFVRHHGLQDITETSYYEMAIDYLEDYPCYNEEADAIEIRRSARLAQSYQKGTIHRTLNRMNGRHFCKDLTGNLQKYQTEKANEQELLELITEGMSLITPESPHLMQYYYDWAYEESPDFIPIGLETQVMLGYSANDALCEQMESYFNSDCQESYAITPVTCLYLTPETDKLFSIDNYPEKLSTWLGRFLKHVSNNF